MKTIIICVNHRVNPNQPSCGARGSMEIADCAAAEITKNQFDIHIERFNCLGFCDLGPNVKIVPDGRCFHGVQLADIPGLISELATLPDEE